MLPRSNSGWPDAETAQAVSEELRQDMGRKKGDCTMAQGKALTLKREIYDSMISDIIEGLYKQGEIINEKQLIEKYGVSKSPVRDALIELCNEGVLISHPRYGYEIVRINEQEIRDIVEFRAMVEGQCLRESAGGMGRSDLEELKEYTLAQSRETTEDLPVLKHWENNTSFHLKLLSYHGNEYCYRLVEKSCGVLTRAYAQRNREKWGHSSLKMDCDSHLKIVDSLLAGDVETSVRELQADIRSFLDILYPNFSTFVSGKTRWAGR